MDIKRMTVVILFLAGVTISIPIIFAADEDVIPSEILKAMDPDIRSGKRPIIAFIRQNEIFGLRNNPRIAADFVQFDFDTEKLSSIQIDILKEWARSGINNILLIQDDIQKYVNLISQFTPKKNFISGYTDNAKAANAKTTKLLRHPVNTDCSNLGFWYGKNYGSGSGAGEVGISGISPNSSIIVESNTGVALCGSFLIGNGKCFFFSPPVGADKRRWELNFWHWALGFPVPGAAETSVASSSLTLGEQNKYDLVYLKNSDIISGRIVNNSFTIKTSYAELKFEQSKIDKIFIEDGERKLDSIILRVGDKMSGVIMEQRIQIKLLGGQIIDVDKDKIISIQLRKIE